MAKILRKLNMDSEDHQCFWAMLTIGFYGLLRLGEITQHIDTRRNLQKSHITQHNDGFFLTLPASKTDQNFAGTSIFIGRSGDITCPVAALSWMLAKRSKSDEFLFSTTNGIATRSWFLTMLNKVTKGLDKLSGHSLRRGGATWAATNGYTHDQIMQLGRWTSNAFRIYLRNHPQLDLIFRQKAIRMHREAIPLTNRPPLQQQL